MPWKLFIVLLAIVILLLLFWVNRENDANISFVFTSITNIPVLVLISIVFTAGGIFGSSVSYFYYKKKLADMQSAAGNTQLTEKKKQKKTKKKRKKGVEDSPTVDEGTPDR